MGIFGEFKRFGLRYRLLWLWILRWVLQILGVYLRVLGGLGSEV